MGGYQETPKTLALVVPGETSPEAVEDALRNVGIESTAVPINPGEDFKPAARTRITIIQEGKDDFESGIGRILERIAEDKTNPHHLLVHSLKTHQGTVTLGTLIEESGLPREKIEHLVNTVFSGHIAFKDDQRSDSSTLNCPHFIPKEVNKPEPAEIFSSV